jgi:hypothetical protein
MGAWNDYAKCLYKPVQKFVTCSFLIHFRSEWISFNPCDSTLTFTQLFTRALQSVRCRQRERSPLGFFFENPGDLGKNGFRRARCEPGHLAHQASKQETVAGGTIRRISRMDNHFGFGSGNSLPGPFRVVSGRIIQVQPDASRRLSALAVAEVPLTIRKNRFAKELCVIPHPGRQCKKTMGAGRRANYGHQAFLTPNCL